MMDFLSTLKEKMEQTQEELNHRERSNIIMEKVEKIHPSEVANWEFRDRQNFELGDIPALAESIYLKGQAQPIIVVLADAVFNSAEKSSAKYIVIAGYRRWLACKEKNIMVDAIVRKLTFEQAIACLVSENEKETVSDYSKGMFYYNLLKKERISKKTCYERLGIKKGMFDNYLSFSEVPHEVWEAVGNLSNVSARTSSTIRLICQKGEAEKNAIISIADKIELGIGEKKILSLVNKIINSKSTIPSKNLIHEFSKNIIMESNDNSIKFTAKKLSDKEIESIKKMITNFIGQFIIDNNFT